MCQSLLCGLPGRIKKSIEIPCTARSQARGDVVEVLRHASPLIVEVDCGFKFGFVCVLGRAARLLNQENLAIKLVELYCQEQILRLSCMSNW